MGLAESKEPTSSEKVDDNKDVRISAIKSRKIFTTTASAILVGKKRSIALIKVILVEDWQDVRVKKIWIETTD